MIENYSIEQESEKIYFSKTREYFKESYSCYKQGNYRAATVTIWSVVIYDLIHKLDELNNVYQDKSAKDILDKISNHRKSSPYSSKWESELVEEIQEKTALIDLVDLGNLKFLQLQRNLSAHPNINNDKHLNSPNKDTTRALIRMALEAVLTKPAFYTDKIIDNIFNDLTSNEFIYKKDDRQESIKALRILLENKYLNHLKKQYEVKIFRSFWRITFKSEDVDAKKNRLSALLFLQVICLRSKFSLEEIILEDKKYYSNISKKKDILGYLSYLISYFPKIYTNLDDDVKIALKQCYIDHEPGTKTLCWFLAGSADDHLDKFKEWMNNDTTHTFEGKQLIAIYRIFDDENWHTKVCKLASEYYAKSSNYDISDKRFANVLSPIIPLYRKIDINELFILISENPQCYERRAAKEDHRKIISHAQKIGLNKISGISEENKSFISHLRETDDSFI